MSNQIDIKNSQAIGEQFATIVTKSPEGEFRLCSFYYGTNAVSSMIELGNACRDLGYQQTLVATDKNYWE